MLRTPATLGGVRWFYCGFSYKGKHIWTLCRGAGLPSRPAPTSVCQQYLQNRGNISALLSVGGPVSSEKGALRKCTILPCLRRYTVTVRKKMRSTATETCSGEVYCTTSVLFKSETLLGLNASTALNGEIL